MSVNLQNKIILASVSRSQLPSNLKDYSCELIIEQSVQDNDEQSGSKKYLVFRHKQNKEASFKIILSKFKRPLNLMHVYKLDNERFSLKGKIERIAESRVDKQIKAVQIKQADFDEDDDFVEKKLVFEKESSEYDSSDDDAFSESSSQGVAPSNDEAKSKIKTAIIEILNKKGKISSIKDLNLELKRIYRIKIPESSTKEIALKVCSVDKKTKGYVLRPEYVDSDERMEGKKKIKTDSY